MAFLPAFRSVRSVGAEPAGALDERCCEILQAALGGVEMAMTATELGDSGVARWARERGQPVDIRTRSDLSTAIAAGVHPSVMTAYVDGLTESDLAAALVLGVGRVVVESVEEAAAVTEPARRRHHHQSVMVQVDASGLDDGAMRAVLSSPLLYAVGLHCRVGVGACAFVSHAAAIGDLVAQMAQVRRQHGILLTRIGIGDNRVLPTIRCLRALADTVTVALDDACMTLDFPRPRVVLSTVLPPLHQIGLPIDSAADRVQHRGGNPDEEQGGK